MPYIKQEDRYRLIDPRVDVVGTTLPKALASRIETAGELNYVLTTLVHEVLKSWGVSYSNFNDVIGAIECMKLELYRRLIVPYEDKKIEENGDVTLG